MEKGKSILLVEEDPIIAANLSRRLQQWQYDVGGDFDNMIDAILAIKKNKPLPDLLLVNIPFFNREQRLNRIKLFLFLYPIPVVIMSSSALGNWRSGGAAHIPNVLFKPFSETQLRNVLHRSLVL